MALWALQEHEKEGGRLQVLLEAGAGMEAHVDQSQLEQVAQDHKAGGSGGRRVEGCGVDSGQERRKGRRKGGTSAWSTNHRLALARAAAEAS